MVNRFPENILPVVVIWLSMALQVIDWTDPGTYKSGWYDGKASRKECGQYAYFRFTVVDSKRWDIKRPSGALHRVGMCSDSGDVIAECDCHDFQEYGAGFGRACIHIWAVRLRKTIVGC